MAWTSDGRLVVSRRVTASIWSGMSFVLLDESGIESEMHSSPSGTDTPRSTIKNPNVFLQTSIPFPQSSSSESSTCPIDPIQLSLPSSSITWPHVTPSHANPIHCDPLPHTNPIQRHHLGPDPQGELIRLIRLFN